MTITTPFGLFEALNTMFGLRNAAQTCQRFRTFIDDFLITSEDETRYYEHLKVLFKRLSEYGVIINPAKCVFGVNKITFLGYTVNKHGIKPLTERVEALEGRSFTIFTDHKPLSRLIRI